MRWTAEARALQREIAQIVGLRKQADEAKKRRKPNPSALEKALSGLGTFQTGFK